MSKTRLRGMPLWLLLLLSSVPSIGLFPAAAAADEERSEPASPPRAWPVIWMWPNGIEELDLTLGAGGAQATPRPPFTFVREIMSGTTAKVLVRDAVGATWALKWGKEARAEVFCTRLVWAAGYFVEPTHFVARGRILGLGPLQRAHLRVRPTGYFKNARFQMWPEGLTLLDGKESWRWDDNPFVGEPWFQGLKIMMMLVSNWDSKDRGDNWRGSNTGVFSYELDGVPLQHYAVTDWGGTMGRWGGSSDRTKWDAEGYAAQTPGFVRGEVLGEVQFGYRGQNTESVADHIKVSDVDWLLHMLGRVSDEQIRDALRASDASPEEVEIFARAVRERIGQLEAVVRESGWSRHEAIANASAPGEH